LGHDAICAYDFEIGLPEPHYININNL